MMNQLYFRQIVWFCLLSLFLSNETSAAGERSIQLLVTSDLHGWYSTSTLYPYRKHSGLAHLEKLIRRLKREHESIVLLDAGDLLQGSPLSFFHHAVSRDFVDRNLFFRRFNDLGYDAVVVGNHDLALNPAFEMHYVPHSSFTWLAANIVRRDHLPFSPYITIIQDGVKIAVLGFTTPGIPMWMGPEQLRGLRVNALDRSVKKWIQRVKTKENPDLLIGLFHAGLNLFRDDENSKLNGVPEANQLRSVLDSNRDFDLVISGHDHQLYPNRSHRKIPRVAGTPVLRPGSRGEALFLVELRLTVGNGGWAVSGIDVSVHRPERNKTLQKAIDQRLSGAFKNYLNEPLPWVLEKSYKQELKDCLNLLLSLSSDQPGLAGTLFPGVSVYRIKRFWGKPLTRAHLFRWIRYDNRSVSILLSSRDIELLSEPIPPFGHKRIPYNRRLVAWLKQDFPESADDGFLRASHWEKKHLIKLADYHYWGGGGIISPLFVEDWQTVEISESYMRDDLFFYLKTHRALPDRCKCLRYQGFEEKN